MVVKRGTGRESGQSILEFIFMFPALLGLTALLYRVNSAIQVSIVNQQYARAQAVWLTFNSPIYPQRAIREREIVGKGANMMVLGVADNQAEEQGFEPIATQTRIGRNDGVAGAKPGPGESPDENGFPRVMNTVTLCTQSETIGKEKRNMRDIGGLDSPAAFRYCQGLFDE